MDQSDFLKTFMAEAAEMLQQMERLLLELEEDAEDDERLNALFRCVHTIKGSAGLFGLDHVVTFTHDVENVLDRLRDSRLDFDQQLSALLFECRDHIAVLVDREADEIDDAVTSAGAQLRARLSPYLDDTATVSAITAPRDHDTWHISVRFGPDILRHGMDPLSFIRYLGTLGELVFVNTVTEHLPSAAELDPEACYLGFEIRLRADVDKSTIEEVFEFVRDDCELRILAPGSRAAEYIELIAALPEDDYRLGEILVRSGALTRSELEEGLEHQEHVRARVDGDEDVARLGEVLVESGKVQPEVVTAALEKQGKAREARSEAHQTLRVQADKLTKLIDLVGELVIASAAANLAAERHGNPEIREAIGQVAGLVEDVRDGSLELRMVPIGETFQRFRRVVRDASQQLGKDIRLDIRGADTELDKTMVESLSEPLTHLVRNAVDHGIESAEERAAAGKSAQGTVALNAFHDAGNIVIEVADDGGGLNRDAILAKAIDRELIQSGEGLSDQDVYQLIFQPGFSTAAQISNLSGRGVGMDVVKRNIDALRGNIEIESTLGRGTTIRIRLPLTLAIIDGFLTGVGDARYVIPLESVVECVELNEEQHRDSFERAFVNLRGEVLPFIRLRDYFELEGEAGRRENIVVVRHGPYKAGLLVDSLLGEYQTVIKPLGKLFENLGAISGSTILGSGEVALILDIPALVQRAAERETRLVQV